MLLWFAMRIHDFPLEDWVPNYFEENVMALFPIFLSLPPATKLGQGYIFTGICHSVNRGGEWYPSMPCSRSQGGCLLPGRVCSQGVPAPKGGGLLPGGVSMPTSKGEIEEDQVQAHTQGGNWEGSDPGPHPRGKLRGIRSRPTPKGEVERIWPRPARTPPPPTTTAAGGTHPTGMHSSY